MNNPAGRELGGIATPFPSVAQLSFLSTHRYLLQLFWLFYQPKSKVLIHLNMQTDTKGVSLKIISKYTFYPFPLADSVMHGMEKHTIKQLYSFLSVDAHKVLPTRWLKTWKLTI